MAGSAGLEGIGYGVQPRPAVGGEVTVPCFRCGVCCTRYQPPVSLTEARSIAAAFGVSLDEFLDRYIDDSWPGSEYYLLDAHDEACVFLERSEGSKVTSCRIHPVRPRACREWAPSLSRKECQQGLTEYWGLTVGPEEELIGPERSIRAFRRSLKSLVP